MSQNCCAHFPYVSTIKETWCKGPPLYCDFRCVVISYAPKFSYLRGTLDWCVVNKDASLAKKPHLKYTSFKIYIYMKYIELTSFSFRSLFGVHVSFFDNYL